MDVYLATKNYGLDKWAEIIRGKAESGLGVTGYCESVGITRHQYYYWRSRIKDNNLEHVSSGGGLPATFAELNPSDCVKDNPDDPIQIHSTPMIEIRIGRASINIGGDISPDMLESVMGVICHAC